MDAASFDDGERTIVKGEVRNVADEAWDIGAAVRTVTKASGIVVGYLQVIGDLVAEVEKTTARS